MGRRKGKKNDKRRNYKLLAEILEFIGVFYRENGHPPTYRDIAGGTGTTIEGAYRYVTRLVDEGQVVRQRRVARSVMLRTDAERLEGRK